MKRIAYYPIFIFFFVTLVASYSPAFAQASGSGYAWANQPAAKKYTPNKMFSFNSSGMPIVIARKNIGQYTVNFKGLGGKGQAGGNVQVTAYGAKKAVCNVVNWNSGGRDFIVNVMCFDARGKMVDNTYTVSIRWPRASLPMSGSQSLSGGTPTRTINPDGKVTVRYPDGKIIEKSGGATTITYPDGRKQRMMPMQVQVSIPPTPPDTKEREWLQNHSKYLLSMIRSLVNNDDTAINNYLSHEGQDLGLYKQIRTRAQTIDYLVRP
jgi:hypothetical protein